MDPLLRVSSSIIIVKTLHLTQLIVKYLICLGIIQIPNPTPTSTIIITSKPQTSYSGTAVVVPTAFPKNH